MFRTVPLSIIRNSLLYIQQWYMSNMFAGSLRAVSKPVRHIPLLRLQWKPADDGQRNCPKHVELYFKKKFEKLVHLVGFIIRIYHDVRSPERQRRIRIPKCDADAPKHVVVLTIYIYICCAFVSVISKLYKMHGTYIKHMIKSSSSLVKYFILYVINDEYMSGENRAHILYMTVSFNTL